ncbi:MAG: RICIN domain-containing protein [Ruminococcus sp.]|nr:RICIN domain-containing protein [Ruminococcus sp.]
MKRMKAFLTAVMMLSALPLVYQGTAAQAAEAPAVPEGTYLIRNVNSGIYLDVEGGAAANGTNVQQWGAESAMASNIWKVVAEADGYYSIYSMLGDGTQYRLNVGSDDNAENICIAETAETDAQLYRFLGNEDGSYRIVTKSSQCAKAVEVINAETTAGANVQQWITNGVNCQHWQLIPVEYGTDGLTETESTVTGEVFTAGDLNDDGRVNVFDMVVFRQLLSGNAATEKQKYAGNVNGDEEFTLADAVVMQKHLMGKSELKKQAVDVIRKYAGVKASCDKAYLENTNAGFESEAYLNMYNEKDVFASWNVMADEDGIYAVTIRYANANASTREILLSVSGEIVGYSTTFPSTGAWTTWQTITVNVKLKKGLNVLTARSMTTDGAPNIDHITIAKTDEAESATTPIPAITATPSELPGPNHGTVGTGKQMEYLNRGVCAVVSGTGMLVSWRSLATDHENTTFKLYKNGEFVAEIGKDDPTNYFVDGATAADSFTIDTFMDGMAAEIAQPAIILGTKNSGQSGGYLEFGVEKPAEQTMPDGTTCTYTPNDCSVGDVDGDGQYEIFVKWDPSNSKDNANEGYTGSVFIDCYRLDGTRLWRVDLGKNIRAGAHYTQFMVYDFDGDGKAEMICKTADGTVDGKGTVIGDSSVDNRGTDGRVIKGNEYLTLFDGLTGAAKDTINFEPARGNVGDWGDTWGNRCDRMLATVAYLDGTTPSVIMGRGYYAKTAVVAYDVENGKLVKRWSYDTGTNSSDPAFNQGNHSLIPMDVDSDGKDEIIYGSVCFDENGKVKWSTGLGHGDCMQAGDLIPERAGLEVFQVHEHHYVAEVHDAATGTVIWQVEGTGDVGRGIALNLTADSAGCEFTSIVDGIVYAYNPSSGKIESQGYGWNDEIKWSMNSAIWWDDDLEREAMDRTMIEDTVGRRFTGDGSYNNYTKSNACLTADIFGDWREEVILQADGGTKIRIFETTFETDTKLFTLMHDAQYRCGVATENTGYNQAPNASFFLGTGYDLPQVPTIYTYKANQ